MASGLRPASVVHKEVEEMEVHHSLRDGNKVEEDHENLDKMAVNNIGGVPPIAAGRDGPTSLATLDPSPKQDEEDPSSDYPAVEESTKARLERLGRQRPEVFDSIWSEIGFIFSISMSQVLSVSMSQYLSSLC